MQRIHVDSSDVVSIGYDAKSYILEIEFKENRIYQYLDVEPDVYERFMRTDSYGEYFFASISKRYRYKRIDEAAPKGASHDAVVFVSGNSQKLYALQAACRHFNVEVEQLDLPVEEIQSHDSEAVALHKAKSAYKLASRSVVVQDTFWNILALRGFPGAYMHDVADWLRPEDFLALMEDKTDRTVIRTHTIVYYDGKRSKVFSKDLTGIITLEPHGTHGVSIDKIVVTNAQTHTNAEMLEDPNGFNTPIQESAWYEFAKWYNLQRRLGKV